jgi:hypothetical protein
MRPRMRRPVFAPRAAMPHAFSVCAPSGACAIAHVPLVFARTSHQHTTGVLMDSDDSSRLPLAGAIAHTRSTCPAPASVPFHTDIQQPIAPDATRREALVHQ